ncbi:MAG: hypothetical protein NVS1B10_03060 [Candidatus Saccharimonadales bacterium]
MDQRSEVLPSQPLLELNGEASSGLTYTLGHQFNDGERIVFEPDVIYIHEIGMPEISEDNGPGTNLVTNLLDTLRTQGYSIARMTFSNPTMVGLTEKLISIGAVNTATYVADKNNAPKTDNVSTTELLKSEEKLTPEQASAHLITETHLAELSRLRMRDYEAEAVACVLTF